jgi:DNA-binding LytR/AlgR family response regulator
MPTALIADDEPLLRELLERQLAQVWPELEIVARARNGREAVAMFEEHQPDICFLDVQMPGLSGLDAAHQIGRRAHIVFVTAFVEYAVQAFAEGVLDYLVKPVDTQRLADTVERLKERLQRAAPASNTEALLDQLAARLQRGGAPEYLRWIRATIGQSLHLIPVDDVDFLRSDEKYTLVAWRDGGKPSEALIRTSLKDLGAQLDPDQFVQVHRSCVVNLRTISHVNRGLNETADIHLRGRADVLKVSRAYLHLFKQM